MQMFGDAQVDLVALIFVVHLQLHLGEGFVQIGLGLALVNEYVSTTLIMLECNAFV